MSRMRFAIALCLFSVAPILAADAPVMQTPGNMQEAFQQSYQFEGMGKYNDSVRVLLPYYQSNGRDYLINLRLGWLYYLSGAFANSEKHYRAAIQLAPSAVEPRNGYLFPLLAQKRYEDIESIARGTLKLDGNNYFACLRLSFALRMQGKIPAAEAINRQLLRMYPTDVGALIEQGYTALALQRPDEAQKMFQKVLLLDSSNNFAKQGMALLVQR